MLGETLVHLGRKRSKNGDQTAMFGGLIASYQQSFKCDASGTGGTSAGNCGSGFAGKTRSWALLVERKAVIRLRNEEQIDDDVLRTLQRELDFCKEPRGCSFDDGVNRLGQSIPTSMGLP
jgi:hypothetical protein